MFELHEASSSGAVIKVIGVGGAGGNAVNRMVDEGLAGVEFISANTDKQALEGSSADHKIQLGKKLTKGLGAGARPGIGRQAVAEDAEEVTAALEGADLVFIAAGMGGGTGTGAAPVIGKMARDLDALTVAVVTRPFNFEGAKRRLEAEKGLEELRRTVDTMVVVPNDRILAVVGKGTPLQDSFKAADKVLLQATQGISDLIQIPGVVNVDFADVRTIMTLGGGALMGTGVGQGDDRALAAARDALTCELLDNVSIRGAKGVLINIAGGEDLALDEAMDISTIIQDEAGDEAEIIWGALTDSNMEDEVRVTLIAIGFDDGKPSRHDDIGRAPGGVARPQRWGGAGEAAAAPAASEVRATGTHGADQAHGPRPIESAAEGSRGAFDPQVTDPSLPAITDDPARAPEPGDDARAPVRVDRRRANRHSGQGRSAFDRLSRFGSRSARPRNAGGARPQPPRPSRSRTDQRPGGARPTSFLGGGNSELHLPTFIRRH